MLGRSMEHLRMNSLSRLLWVIPLLTFRHEAMEESNATIEIENN